MTYSPRIFLCHGLRIFPWCNGWTDTVSSKEVSAEAVFEELWRDIVCLFVCLFDWTTKLIGKWSSLSRERKSGVRMDDRCKQMLDFVRDVRLPGQPTHHEIGLWRWSPWGIQPAILITKPFKVSSDMNWDWKMGSLIVSTYNFIQEKAEKSHILYHVKRAIFPLIIGTLVISGLLFSSTVAYFVFYWSYIPTVGITREVYLQFRYL